MLVPDLIGSVLGAGIPIICNLVKNIFGKKNPVATLDSLISTKPEIIPEYIKAQAMLLKAETEHFQRDVKGETSRWVSNLRSSIRPIGTLYSFVMLGINYVAGLNLTPGTEASFCFIVSSWFGSRVKIG